MDSCGDHRILVVRGHHEPEKKDDESGKWVHREGVGSRWRLDGCGFLRVEAILISVEKEGN